MLSKQQVFSILLSISVVLSLSNVIDSHYYNHNSYYFSNRDVFRIIETKDERGFAQWLRTYPDVNIRNNQGQTPLMVAARLQHRLFVERLLDAGALKYLIDDYGMTARDYALQAERSVSYVSSNVGSDIATAVVAGAAIGLCAYGLYSWLSDSDVNLSVNYNSYDHNYYNGCPVCHGYVGYTTDPYALYCSDCYYQYTHRYNYGYQPSVSITISDFLRF